MMKKTMHYFLAALLCLTVTISVYSQSNVKNIKTVSGRTINVEQLNNYIRLVMDSLEIPGISIAIIKDAEMVYHHSFGVQNKETREPVNDTTLFEGASLSKPLFAYFVLKMVEKGVIGLDTPLYKYLPHPMIKDNDPRYKLITARMVLSHTTGFPNWANNQPVELKFTPGTGFSYSGEAHQYLTALIAIENKTNWQGGLDSIFQQEVAIPLGMQHTYYVGNEFIARHKASGYTRGKVKELWLPKSFGGAHTLHTEAVDFSKFLVTMMNEEGLQKKTFDEMLKEQIHFSKDDELAQTGQTGWCLGFAMKPTLYGMRYLHTGNNKGFQSYCCFYRGKKYGLVFFTNCEKALAFYQSLGPYLDDAF